MAARKPRLVPLLDVLRTFNDEAGDRDAIARLYAGPAQPRLLSLDGVTRWVQALVDAHARKPLSPALAQPVAAMRKHLGGAYPSLVLGHAGESLRALVCEQPRAARVPFIAAIRAEAARREAEEARDELGASSAIARVVWNDHREWRKRPEAWLLALADGAWASLARDRRKPTRRLWFEGTRDDALATLPEAFFADAARAVTLI